MSRSVTVHIGPHKTGTTALQSALHRRRAEFAARGLHYVGDALQPSTSAKAVSGRMKPGPRRDAALREWRELMETAAPHDHVFLSSEFLSEAGDDEARRIVADAGGEAVRVVVTLRPLAKIITSQWQQHIQFGAQHSFEEWLGHVLDEPDSSEGRQFWRRHRHHELVRRWSGVVGDERTRVIVVDRARPTQLVDAFAELLGVEPALLEPPERGANRSLSWDETEAIRHFNIEFRQANLRRDAQGEPRQPFTPEERRRTWLRLKRATPHPDERPIELPARYAEQVGAAAAAIVAGLRTSGVEIVGDLDSLLEPAITSAKGTPAGVHPRVAGRIAHAVYHRPR